MAVVKPVGTNFCPSAMILSALASEMPLMANRLFLAVCSASVESAPRLVTRFFGSKVERKTWRRLLKTSLEGLGTLPEIWLLVIGDGNAMFTYKFRNQTRKDKNLVWGLNG